MVWQQIASEIDSWNQLGCTVEWKVGHPRSYRFQFFRPECSSVDLEKSYFDPLEGEVEAIQELLFAVQTIVSDHATEQLAARP